MARRSDFIPTIQRFTAIECIGISTLRGQGKGVIRDTRGYLAKLKLGRIPRGSQSRFESWLDRHTEGILDALHIPNRPWGAARKSLNIFLRSVLYNHYLRRKSHVNQIAKWLEIPLDSLVARALKDLAKKQEITLPRWPGLKHFTSEINVPYQEFAKQEAKRWKLPARVFLDNYLWTDKR